MREILFRGQQRKKGEKVRLDGSPVESLWFYGNGVLQSRGQFAIIYQTEPVFSKHSVYSDTLGQYTGVTDKSGVKVFEGDILRDDDAEENGVVIFEEGEFCVMFGNVVTHGIADIAYSCYVRGNIHDNPELLKE